MRNLLYRSILTSCLLVAGTSSAAKKQWWPNNPPSRKPVTIKPGHHVPNMPRGAISFALGGANFFYHTGIFYRWSRDRYIVVSAPVGATVPVLPAGCTPMIIGDETYYQLRESYFRRVPGGYRVSTKPSTTIVVTPPPEAPKEHSVTIWVQNDNGSSTPVLLTASSDGHWVGPKGEYYSTFPTEIQLKPVYGVSERLDPDTTENLPHKEIIWIKNLNGSNTPVELEKQKDGTWKGPSGEIYPNKPSAEDLRSAYGLDG